MNQVAKSFVAYFYFVSWSDISLGISLDIAAPKLSLHLPFGFLVVGLEVVRAHKSLNHTECSKRVFGLTEKYQECSRDPHVICGC